MPPTTLKLPAELKQRIKSLVTGTDESVHSFMLKAIERETALAEQRKDFVRDAVHSRAEFERTGSGYDAADVHAYVRARASGRRATRPKARKWRG